MSVEKTNFGEYFSTVEAFGGGPVGGLDGSVVFAAQKHRVDR